MHYVYLLRSLKDLGYYIGSTENVNERLKEHSKGKTKSIKHRIPFTLKYTEEYATKKEAKQGEIKLKKNYQVKKEILIKLGFDVK